MFIAAQIFKNCCRNAAFKKYYHRGKRHWTGGLNGIIACFIQLDMQRFNDKRRRNQKSYCHYPHRYSLHLFYITFHNSSPFYQSFAAGTPRRNQNEYPAPKMPTLTKPLPGGRNRPPFFLHYTISALFHAMKVFVKTVFLFVFFERYLHFVNKCEI